MGHLADRRCSPRLSPFPSRLPLLPVPRPLAPEDWGGERQHLACVRVRVRACEYMCVRERVLHRKSPTGVSAGPVALWLCDCGL